MVFDKNESDKTGNSIISCATDKAVKEFSSLITEPTTRIGGSQKGGETFLTLLSLAFGAVGLIAISIMYVFSLCDFSQSFSKDIKAFVLFATAIPDEANLREFVSQWIYLDSTRILNDLNFFKKLTIKKNCWLNNGTSTKNALIKTIDICIDAITAEKEKTDTISKNTLCDEFINELILVKNKLIIPTVKDDEPITLDILKDYVKNDINNQVAGYATPVKYSHNNRLYTIYHTKDNKAYINVKRRRVMISSLQKKRTTPKKTASKK